MNSHDLELVMWPLDVLDAIADDDGRRGRRRRRFGGIISRQHRGRRGRGCGVVRLGIGREHVLLLGGRGLILV